MDLTQGPLNRMSARTIRGEAEQRAAGRRGQPRLDFLGLLPLRVIDYEGERGETWRGVRPIERGQPVQQEPGRLTRPPTRGARSRRHVQGAGQRALLVGARWQDCPVFPRGPPLRSALGEQTASSLVGQAQRCPRAQRLEGQTKARSLPPAFGILLLGRALRPFPFPPQLLEPVAQSFR